MAELPPSSSPPLTTATSVASAPPTLRRSASDGRARSLPRLTRRQSTQERINEILETARERAETLSAAQSGAASPRMEPLLGSSSPSRGHGTISETHESSADEATGIVMRGASPRLGYQSITSAPSTAATSGTFNRRRTGGGGQSREQVAGAGGGVDGAPAGHEDGESRAPHRQRDEKRWVSTFLASFRSIELENKGSVARDHLALERTFLAWLRTSLAFASIGIAITQLFRLNTSISNSPGSGDNNSHLHTLRHVGKPLGATFLAISILMLFLGYNRYHTSQRWIIKGKFPASRGTILIVSFVAFGLMIASLIVVIVVQPALTES